MLIRGLAILLIGFHGFGQAADFSLKDVDGTQHRLADYRGKWVVINYWAGWCAPCVEELSELVFFHDTHQQDAVVLGFNIESDKSNQQLKQYIKDFALNYPILRSPRSLPGYGEVALIPTTFIISPAGDIVSRKVGGITGNFIEAMIAKASSPAKLERVEISEIGP